MALFPDQPFATFHESGAPLTLVTGYFWTYPTEPGSDMLGILRLQFGKELVHITVDDADTLAVGDCPDWIDDTDLIEHDLSNRTPWRTAMGKPLLWSWAMTDQDGVFDGLQLEFAENVEDESVIVQLIRMPTELKVRVVDSGFRSL